MANKKSLKDMPGAVWGKDKYETHRGGGTPSGEDNAFHQGIKVNPSGKGRGGWSRISQPGKREDDQPRDKEGHFTYNSMIGKPLKDISKKNGKSRGKTVPPMFNGGVNGTNVSDWQYKGGKQDLKARTKWNGKWFEKGTEVVAFGAGSRGQDVIKIAPENMHEIAKEWVINNFGEEVEWKTVKGNENNEIYKETKDENGKVIYRTKTKSSDNGHKVLVYKGTGEPVDFADLAKRKGEFGRGNMASQKAGEAKETGNIQKWQSKAGAHTQSEKLALKGKQEGFYGTVKADENEAADIFGNKVHTKYLEDEKAVEEAAELEKARKKKEREELETERAKKREIKEVAKGPEIKSDTAKQELKSDEKKTYDVEGGLDVLDNSTDSDKQADATGDIVSSLSEKEVNDLLGRFNVDSKEKLVDGVRNLAIDPEELSDALKEIIMPGLFGR